MHPPLSGARKQTNSKIIFSLALITDEVNCPWLAVVLLFDGKIPPARLEKRLTGDEAFCILETIVVDGDRLKIKKKKSFIWV